MVIDSPVGHIELCASKTHLLSVSFVDKPLKSAKHSAILRAAEQQLSEYFSGDRTQFHLPIGQTGTEFQQKVWQALQDIPYGETISYKTLAQRIGNPKAVRAVGGANNKNRLAIVVPCHRVIGQNGKLVGYASGVDTKQKLLSLEGIL
ncbi:methylated-DNA--[protein]-cysteine S-methyltransferase [Thalassotalea agarivorans]|nr:methylated-DNA--[protein]-cysteine S-methyltransferase [Thalassotalea agarivorans]